MDYDVTTATRHPYRLADILTIAAAILETDTAALDPDEALGYLGFDSASLKLLAGRLSQHFATPVDTVQLFTYPTLRSLSEYLAEQDVDTSEQEAAVDLPARPMRHEDDTSHDIAIVGLSCRLPGAASKEQFWANQAARRNCIREVPKRRWDWQALFGDPLRENGRTDVRWGGFIDGEDQFAPEFFGISVYEAEQMDPQHRLFLKAAWEAIWDAGYDPAQFAGKPLGVFAGVQFQDYQKLLDQGGVLSAQACTGNAHAMLANRVSFLLDAHGPSEAIDTACSSSLVAIHNAVRAIRQGECDVAIAGGVNLLLTPDLFIMGRQLGVLSPTGQCRTFDAAADGYVRGEGVGALLLKPLRNAVEDRDHIYGVIKGTAVNHGGKAASLTAPNSRAHADLVMRALKDARMTPNDISYVEMHGTGTELGDPIELEGVKTAFRKLRAEGGLPATACAIGSVKTNIGHLEPAAGVAGVTNVVMAMANRTLPGLSNFRSLNPHLQLEDGFSIQSETTPWLAPASGKSLAAVVNSFGFGGANACVVVAEHTAAHREPAAAERLFVPVAASNAELMKIHADELADAVGLLEGRGGDELLADVAFTLRSRNEGGAVRAAVLASSLAELQHGLRAIAAGGALPDTVAMSGFDRPGQADWPENVVGWLGGGIAEWPEIARARRCPLPLSPWPDRTCWFEPRADADMATDEPAQMIYLERHWRAQEAGTGPGTEGKCVWIIGRSDAQLEVFEARLRAALPARTTLVTSLLDAPAEARPEPSLEVWNLAGDEPDAVIVLPPEVSDAAAAANGETRILFGLAKELMERSFGRGIDVFYLDGFDFGVSPAADALPALAKSAFLENERLKVHTIFCRNSETGDLAELVAAELSAADPRTPLVIRFNPAREVQGLRLADLQAGPARPDTWFRPGGVYLIAGGMGELGYRLLEKLVGQIDATFILCGRSQLQGLIAERLDLLRGQARTSDSIHYVACDITDGVQTRAMVDAILLGQGRLNGVVNMVTAHNDAYLFRKDWADFATVAASKVEGTINLDLATANVDLDFFVAFSSLAALGLAGGSDYAYGCAFQNAFAQWRERAVAAGRRRGASHAISWSRWKWDKYVTETFDKWFASLGYAFLDIEEGLDAWRAIMGRGSGEIFATQGWQERILRHLDLETGLMLAGRKDAEPTGLEAVNSTHASLAGGSIAEGPPDRAPVSNPISHAAEEQAVVSPGAGGGEHVLEVRLSAIIRELLKLDEIDPQSPFPSLGLDSVMAIRLIVLVEQRMQLRLSPKELLQYPSVALLAAHLRSQNPAQLASGPPSAGDLDAVATYLTSSLKKMLRADAIPTDAKFTNLGVDSIIAVKLASELDRRFEIGISPRWFIDFPSVDRMSREIEKRRSTRR